MLSASSYDPYFLHELRHQHPRLHPNHVGLVRIAHAQGMHDLAALDGELEDLTARRRAVLTRLGAYRERLWPGVTGRHQRKACRLEDEPMPPAAVDAVLLWGGDLRRVIVAIARRHGALGLREVHGLIHRYGYVVSSARPVQRLADAAAFEARHGRLERIERGVYGPGLHAALVDDGEELPAAPRTWSAPAADEPGTHDGAVDPDVAGDPERWSRGTWPPDAQVGGEWCPGAPDPFIRDLAEELDATVAAARDRCAEVHADRLGPPPPSYDPSSSQFAWRTTLAALTGDPAAPPPTHPGPATAPLGDDSSTIRSPMTGDKHQGAGGGGEQGPDWRDGDDEEWAAGDDDEWAPGADPPDETGGSAPE